MVSRLLELDYETVPKIQIQGPGCPVLLGLRDRKSQWHCVYRALCFWDSLKIPGAFPSFLVSVKAPEIPELARAFWVSSIMKCPSFLDSEFWPRLFSFCQNPSMSRNSHNFKDFVLAIKKSTTNSFLTWMGGNYFSAHSCCAFFRIPNIKIKITDVTLISWYKMKVESGVEINLKE